jgi:hypothetical protein
LHDVYDVVASQPLTRVAENEIFLIGKWKLFFEEPLNQPAQLGPAEVQIACEFDVEDTLTKTSEAAIVETLENIAGEHDIAELFLDEGPDVSEFDE